MPIMQPSGIPSEDQNMLNNQVVCGECFNRFTTTDDFSLHFAIIHEKQATPKAIMERLEAIEQIVGDILVTVSK